MIKNIIKYSLFFFLGCNAVIASDINDAEEFRQRFRAASDYAASHGFGGCFPNFEQADHGRGLVFGHVILRKDEVDYEDVLGNKLASPSDITAFFRSVNDYGRSNGYASAFPNFHQADYGHGVVYGVILLKTSAARRESVSVSDLGEPVSHDIGARFRAANQYAIGNSGAYPDFHQGLEGGELHYGTVVITGGFWRDIYADIIHMYRNFTWNSDITHVQRMRSLERFSHSYERALDCRTHLTDDERKKLISYGYRKNISIGINTTPRVNASARLNSNLIWINFNVLFPQGDREIAQTLIHELMHCAGYTHPQRTASDRPYDGGAYYNSPPLRAELCIAGQQSDRAPAVDGKPEMRTSCAMNGDTCVYSIDKQ